MTLASCQSSQGPSGRDSTSASDFLELENIDDPAAIAWAEARNKESAAVLQDDKLFQDLKGDVLKILQAKDRIPEISIVGQEPNLRVRNFWQDEKHKKGILREQSLKDYLASSPLWKTVLDVDALAAKEKEEWVYRGVRCQDDNENICLLHLSRRGGDAVVIREYDFSKGDFVVGGFQIPESRTSVQWLDRDTLWVGLATDPSLVTQSGLPMTIRTWKRGTDLELIKNAAPLFSGRKGDVSAWLFSFKDKLSSGETKTLHIAGRFPSSNESEYWLINTKGETKPLPFPRDVDLGVWKDGLFFFQLKKDGVVLGKKVVQGALYAFDVDAWENGKSVEVETVFMPTERQALRWLTVTRDHVLISYLDEVRGRLGALAKKNGRWTVNLLSLGENGEVKTAFSDYRYSQVLYQYTDFLTPPQLYLANRDLKPVLLRRAPARFNSKGMVVEARQAISRDGTKVPYFLILPNVSKRERSAGQLPTLIDAYGGFQYPETPYYLSAAGKLWVERGGAMVIANIRGGGEFGPRWHLAALKEKRQNAFDDLFAVAEDLIQTKVTSAAHLGMKGGSNGGLLAGVALTQRPDLFGAVISQVPLLDMLRFHKLLVGPAWIGEYGDPEKPEEAKFLRAYSPYHNLKAGVKYPEAFFTTSTRDDRVHPGHARRMVAKMMSMGIPVLYYENIEGGHGGAATLESRAGLVAQEYRYLWRNLAPQKK